VPLFGDFRDSRRSVALVDGFDRGLPVVAGFVERGVPGVLQAEIGAVPAGRLDPLFAGLFGIVGHHVHGVRVPAPGQADICAGGVGGSGEQQIGVACRLPLNAVGTPQTLTRQRNDDRCMPSDSRSARGPLTVAAGSG